MGYIRASKFREIDRQRKAAVAEYDKKREAFDTQDIRYREAISIYKDEISQYIWDLIESSLGSMKDAVSIFVDSRSITITYSPDSNVGISWRVKLYLYQDWASDEEQFKFEPTISTRSFNLKDLDILKSTYEFFEKLSQLDLEYIMRDANAKSPKKEDYYQVKDPGKKEWVTQPFSQMKSNARLDDCAGKDLWIFVDITREHTYDPGRTNARYRGVQGKGLIKVVKASRTNVIFYWLKSKSTMDYSEYDINGATSQEIKLERNRIDVLSPFMSYTTDDLLDND